MFWFTPTWHDDGTENDRFFHPRQPLYRRWLRFGQDSRHVFSSRRSQLRKTVDGSRRTPSPDTHRGRNGNTQDSRINPNINVNTNAELCYPTKLGIPQKDPLERTLVLGWPSSCLSSRERVICLTEPVRGRNAQVSTRIPSTLSLLTNKEQPFRHLVNVGLFFQLIKDVKYKFSFMGLTA